MTSRKIMVSSIEGGEGHLSQTCVYIFGDKAQKGCMSVVMLLDLGLDIKAVVLKKNQGDGCFFLHVHGAWQACRLSSSFPGMI